MSCAIAAVSVGVVDGRIRVDLPYEEDSRAEVDMNVVATDTGTLVEIQGTGEGATFPRSTLDKLLDLALSACDTVFAAQREALALPYPGVLPEGPGAAEGVRKLTRLLVASRNRKKLAELRRVLDGAGLSGLTLVSLNDVAPFDEAPETGATFEDNALAKARDAFAATGSGQRGRRLRFGGRGAQRHARGALGALVRQPWRRRRATPRCCWRSCVMFPTAGAVRRSCRPARWSRRPTKSSSAANGRAPSPGSRAATAGSATTRSSSRTDPTGRRAAQPGGEGRGVAPGSRAGVAGAAGR